MRNTALLSMCVVAVVSSIGCYKPYVSPEAITAVTEVDEKNLPPNLEPLGVVEVSVTGDARYPELGITNGRAAAREAAYKKGATFFAVVVVKQGFMSTDVIAKIYRKKLPETHSNNATK